MNFAAIRKEIIFMNLANPVNGLSRIIVILIKHKNNNQV